VLTSPKLKVDNKYPTVYNKGIMKIKLSYKEQRPNVRQHFVLFADDSPYKPKFVKRKDTYKRKPKHSKKEVE